MNRRDFFRRGAMALGAVCLAPAATLLAEKEFAEGGVVDSTPVMIGETVSDSVIHASTANAMNDYWIFAWRDAYNSGKIYLDASIEQVPHHHDIFLGGKNVICTYVDEYGVHWPGSSNPRGFTWSSISAEAE